jgi:hypothetical protein
MSKTVRAALMVAMLFMLSAQSMADYRIGVYYFPGWKDNLPHAPSLHPWEPIKKFPERKPLLGWYKEGSKEIMRKQIDWMHEYGISFIAFDWYFTKEHKEVLGHALSAYLDAPNRGKEQFSLLWANHTNYPSSLDDWDAMVNCWINDYLPRREFLKIDGKPVIFVFSADALVRDAARFGKTSGDLIARAQTLAREHGLPGIYFVACTGARSPMIDRDAKASGYSAFSAYNYWGGPASAAVSHTFTELDYDYREHWERFARKGNLPLIVPMISGWDRRPWGPSSDPLHDNCLSTPEEFRTHLSAAKSFMDAHPLPSGDEMGIICAWNEFGEGSFIEPTESHGFAYLEQIRDVFGGPR